MDGRAVISFSEPSRVRCLSPRRSRSRCTKSVRCGKGGHAATTEGQSAAAPSYRLSLPLLQETYGATGQRDG